MKRRFFFHFNKPLSKQLGKVMWSVHFKNTCYFVEKIQCKVECESKARNSQPFAIMRGFAKSVEITNNLAVIT